MSKDCISREGTLKALREIVREENHLQPPIYEAIDVIETIPEMPDVAEVKHGWWKLDKHGGLICSECQSRALYLEMGWYFNLHIKQIKSVYCPYCGAKMDKENEYG